MSEEASRWNQDKERWDKLWRGTKVRAAPIPKALTFLCTPLRLDKRKSPSATFLSFYLAAGMTVPVNGSGIHLQQDQGVSDFASGLLDIFIQRQTARDCTQCPVMLYLDGYYDV